MRNNLQNNVKIENAKQYASKFNLSGSYSGSASMGEVSVKFSRLLQPNTKAMAGEESLIYLAPLAAPAYAKQYYKTWHMFVPVADVWPNYDAFVTQQKISRNGQIIQPTWEPHCPKDILSLFALNGAKCSLYFKKLNDESFDDIRALVSGGYFDVPDTITSGTYQTLLDNALSGIWFTRSDGTPVMDVGKIVGCSGDGSLEVESGNLTKDTFKRNTTDVGQSVWYGYDVTGQVTMENADYCLYRKINPVVGDGTYIVCYAFRLSSWGIHYFKTLRGLGYGVDMDAWGEARSILPLIATYQAYWDTFGLNLWQNFESTYCGRLKSALEQTNSVDVSSNDDLWPLFKSFIMTELGAMWVTEKNDYVSAHLPQPVVSSPNMTPLEGVFDVPVENNAHIARPNQHIFNGPSPDPEQYQPSINQGGDGHAYTIDKQHGYLDSEILKRLYKRTNANTALGKKIIDLMRSQGLGTYLERTRTNYIGDTSIELQINSVVSQSDTFKQSNNGVEGAMLGQRAGKGVGYKPNNKKLYYKTDCLGYWICFEAVTCDSGWSQAEDMTLKDVQQHEKYQPDYEDLGYQLDSKAVINGSRNDSFGGVAPESKRYSLTMSRQPYGFAPRGSQYKVGRSCVSGGFALRSTRNQFLCYNMDKQVFPDEFLTQEIPNLSITVPSGAKKILHMLSMKTSDVPTASLAYRYLARYPWMGNLSRIFAYNGQPIPYSLWLNGVEDYDALAKVWEYHYRNEDNYLIIGEVWFKAWSHMLPIEETYGTIDHDKKELEYVERV